MREREPLHEQEATRRKGSEVNECGGKPEQKEERRPTRNRNHRRKAKKRSERAPAERVEGSRAEENRAASDRRVEKKIKREIRKPRRNTDGRGEKKRETKTKPQIARTHVQMNGKLRET